MHMYLVYMVAYSIICLLLTHGVFMLQVASVRSRCCICFTHMLQVYVPNILSASYVCCTQVFHVASVSYFRGMLRESCGYDRVPREGHLVAL